MARRQKISPFLRLTHPLVRSLPSSINLREHQTNKLVDTDVVTVECGIIPPFPRSGLSPTRTSDSQSHWRSVGHCSFHITGSYCKLCTAPKPIIPQTKRGFAHTSVDLEEALLNGPTSGPRAVRTLGRKFDPSHPSH